MKRRIFCLWLALYVKKWSAFAAEALLEKDGLSEKTLRVIPLRLKML